MKIDVRPYKVGMDAALHLFEKHKENPLKAINLVSQYASCALIVVVEYARSHVFGDTPEIMRMRDGLARFYRYSEITRFDGTVDKLDNV
jgi:hypothetical protein